MPRYVEGGDWTAIRKAIAARPKDLLLDGGRNPPGENVARSSFAKGRRFKGRHFATVADKVPVRYGETYVFAATIRGKGGLDGIYSLYDRAGNEVFPRRQGLNCFKNSKAEGEWRTVTDTVGVSQEDAAAMRLVLEAMGKQVTLFCDGKVPDQLFFVPGHDLFRIPEGNEGPFDLMLAVDVSDERRMGACMALKNVSKRTAGASENSASENSADTTGIRDGVPYIEDATDGILIGRENTSGWERIENEVSKAAAPAQIYIEMNGGTVVPKAALEDISGRDVTCFFVMNDEIIWAVNGLSFTAEPEDTDLRVRTGTKNIPSKLVNEIADVYPHTNLTIEHDGPFGFTAIMSINLGSDNKGLFANLYYYNEEQNSLEFVDSKEIDGNGRASFEFEHASDYTVITRGDALTEKTAAAIAPGGTGTYTTPPEGAKPVSSPKNPGRIWLIVVSFISFALCGFILFMPDDLRKRKKRFA